MTAVTFTIPIFLAIFLSNMNHNCKDNNDINNSNIKHLNNGTPPYENENKTKENNKCTSQTYSGVIVKLTLCLMSQ